MPHSSECTENDASAAFKAHSIPHERLKAGGSSSRSEVVPFAQEEPHNDASYCQYGNDAANNPSNHGDKSTMERELCEGAAVICTVQAHLSAHCTSVLLVLTHLHFNDWHMVALQGISQSICIFKRSHH